MTDEQATDTPSKQPPATGDDAPADAINVESLRVTVDAQGLVVPDGDPAGTTVLTGRAAADALAATKAQQPAEAKARKAAPEDKGR